ncbi:uncharacterized protein L201_002043 [Kwoniella dendrophila CBS 6074]|uniref:Golgi to ER traffic protein 2 n=1 Tax=Kwoniella dendrophila CBS 6074 TaxID=1295534 RepID=A0AAX4JP47_9TREE
MSDAASRAAARKAKILARGNTGLAKLAQSARGEEAQALYADDFKPSPISTPQTETPPPNPSTSSSSGPSSTSTSQPKSKPSWAPEQPSSSTANTAGQTNVNPNLTAEQQAMSAQLEAMMSMFGGGSGGPPGLGGEGGMPDMSQLLQQMMGGMNPNDSQRLLGDLDDPAGLGGPASGGIPPGLFGGGGGNGGDMPFPFPGMEGLGGLGGFGGGMIQKKSKSEKYFPLVHFVSIILLSLFTIIYWEPKLYSTTTSLSGLSNINSNNLIKRWSSQSKSIGKFGGVEIVPVFWAWTTLELILQTSRFMIFKSPPKPPSLIANFLPLLPPKISTPIITISRYISLILQSYKDGCLLIFILGLNIILSQYLDGNKVF